MNCSFGTANGAATVTDLVDRIIPTAVYVYTIARRYSIHLCPRVFRRSTSGVGFTTQLKSITAMTLVLTFSVCVCCDDSALRCWALKRNGLKCRLSD